jgi:solute carrier family 25 S-adenosylmethionine transporter 26
MSLTLFNRVFCTCVVILLCLVIQGRGDVLSSATAASTRSLTKRLPWLSDGFKEGLASALATSVVKAVLQPLDTIKTVQQGKSLGPLRATASIIQTRGIGGLWSGLGVTVIGSAPSAAVYFGSYSSIKKRLVRVFPSRFKLLAFALSASVANTLASVFRVPYEVIKQRMQIGMFDTAWAAIIDCWKNEGVSGLFGHGKLTSQIARDVPYAVATLVTYEILQASAKTYLASLEGKMHESGVRSSPHNRDKFANALCGSIAGGFGSFVTNPMDVIKTRMMTTKKYVSVMAAAARIYREEGAGAFMIGVSSRLMHKVPANGLFFFCYEWFRILLDIEAIKVK